MTNSKQNLASDCPDCSELDERRLRALAKLGEPTGWFDGPLNTVETAKDLAALLTYYVTMHPFSVQQDPTLTRTMAMLTDMLDILDVQVEQIVTENTAFRFSRQNAPA